MLYISTKFNYTSQVEYKLQYSTIQADFRGDVVNISNAIAEEARLVAVRDFPDLPPCNHKRYDEYQTCHKAV